MAIARDLPYGSFQFDVRIGNRRRGTASGFSEVVLPVMSIDGPDRRAAESTDDSSLLVLRRGYTGELDLYEWWRQARESKRSRGRVVVVELLCEEREPVTTWRFIGCRPVSLAYSPLNALESAVLSETITLSFEQVEMS